MAVDFLTVDDRAAIRKILPRVLVQPEVPLGQVCEAGDGVEALAALHQQRVGLVLTDINLPDMDGLELLSLIKEKLPGLI